MAHKLVVVWRGGILVTNRDLFRALARCGWQVIPIVPSARQTGVAGSGAWEVGDEYRAEDIQAPVRVWGHPLLYTYRYLGALRALQAPLPDAILLIEEPYLPVTFQIVRWASSHGVRVYAYTAQNQPRAHPWLIRKMEDWVLARLAGVWCVNDEARERVMSRGYRGNARVIGLGVDPTRFCSDAQKCCNERPVALYVGRIAPEKGVVDLVRAIELAHDWQLRLVGDGPQTPSIRALIAQSPARHRITLEPARRSHEIPLLLAEGDVLVLPSRTTPRWKEQFGRVLVEAMACGVAVVGSDSGEIPKVIGNAGVIYPEGDVSVLAECLARLAEQSLLRVQLAQTGRKRVLESYTWDIVARLLTELIRDE